MFTEFNIQLHFYTQILLVRHKTVFTIIFINTIKTMNVKSSKILVCVGTCSELIKCAPVIKSLEKRGVELVVVNLGRKAGLRQSLLEQLDVSIDHHLETARFGPSVDVFGGRLLDRLSSLLESETPDLVLVQGDTASAALAAWAAGERGIPVGHVDAAQHAGNLLGQRPAEMNSRKVGRGAGHHFVVTESDRRTLLGEGRAADSVHVVGNTAVDALRQTLASKRPSKTVEHLQQWAAGKRLVVLSTHGHENFGETMSPHLRALREFIERQPDLCLVFPVHKKSAVCAAAAAELDGHPRIRMIDPLEYFDFNQLLSGAWLVVSDSGDIQEEVTTLGIPMIVLRESSECSEAAACGGVRFVGGSPERLREMLRTALIDRGWHINASRSRDVFGDGHAAERICDLLLGTRNTRYASLPLLLAA
jgi:UDP-N-acetylglucosamine 2-epimerase (non-hydrolysing)